MTQLDEARAEACAEEAVVQYETQPEVIMGIEAWFWIARKAIRLYAEGWQPTPLVDPDLIAARGIVANSYALQTHERQQIVAGNRDLTMPVKIALTAFKAGRATK